MLQTLIALTVHRLMSTSCKVLTDLEPLGGTSDDIMELTIRVKTTNDLILRWHVELLHNFIKLLFQSDILSIQAANMCVFLRK